MVYVYYHYNNGVSRRGSHHKSFETRSRANRWIEFMSGKYPKFQVDEVFES